MDIRPKEFEGVHVWQVPAWIEAGFSHGFLGASLDFKNSKARSNWSSLSKGFPLSLLKQMSRDGVFEIGDKNVYEVTGNRHLTPEADAWIVGNNSLLKQTAVGILTADCAPVILFDRASSSSALVHLGWRGVALGLLEKSFEALGSPTGCELAIGPCCSGEAYEVEKWVLEAVSPKDSSSSSNISTYSLIEAPEPLSPDLAEKVYLDVPGIIAKRAEKMGLSRQNIYLSNLCTIKDERFFSYRRQKEQAGRQLSFLGGDFI